MVDAAEVVTVTLGELTFRTGRRTAAHIEWTTERLFTKHPDARLRIIQGSYNSNVEASAGTHDKDGVLDVEIVNVDWLNAQRFLRAHGWAAWWRRPDQGFTNHIHMVSLGCPGPLGDFVPGQLDDYRNRRDGLASHAVDRSWFPSDIDATVFDYPRWLRDQEDKVPYSDWPQADKNALRDDLLAAKIEVTKPDGSKSNMAVSTILRQLWQKANKS